ncbi:TolB family protein [Chengkuizengella axinellae]|uniref:Translocation protein TolB n=1 Tax=Chengkuizengella axinellae TaxID=3064388 RepID=A0ABT9J132_9BACL|nr:translocation protein TolB [Chengkuizengella sp. 2205SS18-9]MDP5275285.1 translocation protein TolB [Chengkuizengella sp. 2205SS18-9]
MKNIILCLIMFVLFIQPFSTIFAQPRKELKAAFVRDQDLWIKMGDEEVKVTQDVNVRYPKWSFDGKWIAYMTSQTEEETNSTEEGLWIFHLKSNKRFKISSFDHKNFQWAPNQNVLAFQEKNDLKVLDISLLSHSQNITSDIINYSWLPDGSGLLTSSKAGNSVYSDIVLTKILIDFKKNEHQSEHLYTIPVKEVDRFYGTSQFKWSYDHQWIAFLLVPTPSMSTDTNTVSVLSNDGSRFSMIEEMLNYRAWFQWAPKQNLLGFIQGYNRNVMENKKLEVYMIEQNMSDRYTPKGYVDRDLTWQDDDNVYVSRSMEMEWTIDVEQRPMPAIYKVHIGTGVSKQVTFPSTKEGDFRPQYLDDEEKLSWIRTNRSEADVWVANSEGIEEKIWIENIHVGYWYYEHWDWDEVFHLYQS